MRALHAWSAWLFCGSWPYALRLRPNGTVNARIPSCGIIDGISLAGSNKWTNPQRKHLGLAIIDQIAPHCSRPRLPSLCDLKAAAIPTITVQLNASGAGIVAQLSFTSVTSFQPPPTASPQAAAGLGELEKGGLSIDGSFHDLAVLAVDHRNNRSRKRDAFFHVITAMVLVGLWAQLTPSLG